MFGEATVRVLGERERAGLSMRQRWNERQSTVLWTIPRLTIQRVVRSFLSWLLERCVEHLLSLILREVNALFSAQTGCRYNVDLWIHAMVLMREYIDPHPHPQHLEAILEAGIYRNGKINWGRHFFHSKWNWFMCTRYNFIRPRKRIPNFHSAENGHRFKRKPKIPFARENAYFVLQNEHKF